MNTNNNERKQFVEDNYETISIADGRDIAKDFLNNNYELLKNKSQDEIINIFFTNAIKPDKMTETTFKITAEDVTDDDK